ncbi:hypothetical protein PL321_01300 [Caloramator sp. mosi_1]|uniref:hypothetical protein n=1 Tax=Caloramator sp. mosi_1 TaxID=3023090 RepID=UPI0023628C96|nr:hypothetical protein [Caloramator sp. mosi_1]WDC84468.1 hypothetical protein PL321_01300 [Caloramator sp. mosi_1]
MFDKGIYEYFVFTLEKNETIFKSLGFKEVAKSDSVVLLEGGTSDVNRYLMNMLKLSGVDAGKKGQHLL